MQIRFVLKQCTSFVLQTNRKIDYIVAFDIIAYEDTSSAVVAHQTSHIVTFFPTCIEKIACCYDRVVTLSYPGH